MDVHRPTQPKFRPNVSHETMYLEKYLEDHEVREKSQGHEVIEIAYSCEICNGSSL
jgi:hypothetical protein